MIYSVMGKKIPAMYAGKYFGILSAVFLLIWVGMIEKDKAKYTKEESGWKERIRRNRIIWMLAACVMELGYFYYGSQIRTTTRVMDSFVTSGIVAAAVCGLTVRKGSARNWKKEEN